MSETISELDSRLSYVLILNTVMTVYNAMFNIYLISLFKKYPEIQDYVLDVMFTTFFITIQLIISCFICGSVESKSVKIYEVLDDYNAKHLSDTEYKQLVLFKSISQKTTFGFTVGGFACLKKTTLIHVIINKLI